MLRILPIFLSSFFILATYGQKEVRLPAGLRQHNLTTYNASLFNPAFSLDRNNPQSIAFWVRWQGQAIDADPTTMFLNYTRKLNDKSAAAVAFFQQNTGVFFNTGGALNYAYQLEFSSIVKLALGINVFAFKQTLADDRFPTDPNVPLPLPTVADDFILQMAPGASLSIERLTLSIASENLFDYNFTAKEANTEKEDKIFMSLLSYDFPITLGSVPNAFLRPSLYLRTIPGQSNQVGFYTLLNTNKYWGQVGYNNFYGYAVGFGGTFLKHLSLGALVEFGTSASVSTKSSFELMAAYFFGKPVDAGLVQLSGWIYDFERQQVLDLQGETDAEGAFAFEFDLPEYLVGGAESGVADYILEVAVTDGAAHTEQITRDGEAFLESVRYDLEGWLDRLVAENDPLFTHTAEGPDDMPAHIKAALTSTTLSIPVIDGGLALGTWQGVYLWEHRRTPRPRQIAVHVGS